MVKRQFKKAVIRVASMMLLLSGASLSAATISVKTDRQDVGLNESFLMVFESDSSVDDDPDFSALNTDFQILSRSSSSNMSIVNGKISSTKKWQLTVLARRAGKLIIPPVSFGKDLSQASFVNVKSGRSATSKSGADRNIFIEVEVDEPAPYVQAQVIYTIRLFLSVAASNASLSEPGISNAKAIIERINEDSRYQVARAGRRFEVVERRYTIYPQVSGSITIEPVTFQGQTNRSAFSIFDPFGPQPKTIVERSEAITLKVKPVPESFPGNDWLPAKMLVINESWPNNPPSFQVGEPLTRTITLTAQGQMASQLPVMEDWIPDDFKQYPDQPILNDDKKVNGITATRQEKTAIIPNQAGKYVLPEISVPWWNTESDQLEYAKITERQIDVAASQNSVTTQSSPLKTPQLDPVQLGEPEVSPPAQTVSTGEAGNAFWQWLSGGLTLAWIATLLLWWRSRSRPAAEKEDGRQLKMKSVIKLIHQACRDNNSSATRQSLLDWARLKWGATAPLSLGEIGKRCSSELAGEIAELNDSLYSKQAGSWSGEGLWQAFNEFQRAASEDVRQDEGELKPLYKL